MEIDDEYTRRLDATLAQFPPMSEDARRKLVQLYEEIEVSQADSA
ncbi:hypothetical protein [Streptomyces sp. OK228]|nr:hypothetical protein [Streptomyces sp. OK228]